MVVKKTDFAQNGFDEAVRYYRNARGLLARCKVEDNFYRDIKPVREAFGTAWLAVDHAIKSALLGKGLTPEQIPESWEPLLAAVSKHLAVRNGKLVKLLVDTHDIIHIAGYYRGHLRRTQMAKDGMEVARLVIEKISGRKIG